MSFHVKDNFRAGTPVSSVSADWFNKVGGFINALVGGLGIKLVKPQTPSGSAPVCIDIDPATICEIVGDGVVAEPSATVDIESGVKESAQMSLKADTFTAGNEEGKGAVVYLPCRSVTDGSEVDFVFRPFKITNDGRIYSIGAEANWQGVIDAAMNTAG